MKIREEKYNNSWEISYYATPRNKPKYKNIEELITRVFDQIITPQRDYVLKILGFHSSNQATQKLLGEEKIRELEKFEQNIANTSAQEDANVLHARYDLIVTEFIQFFRSKFIPVCAILHKNRVQEIIEIIKKRNQEKFSDTQKEFLVDLLNTQMKHERRPFFCMAINPSGQGFLPFAGELKNFQKTDHSRIAAQVEIMHKDTNKKSEVHLDRVFMCRSKEHFSILWNTFEHYLNKGQYLSQLWEKIEKHIYFDKFQKSNSQLVISAKERCEKIKSREEIKQFSKDLGRIKNWEEKILFLEACPHGDCSIILTQMLKNADNHAQRCQVLRHGTFDGIKIETIHFNCFAHRSSWPDFLDALSNTRLSEYAGDLAKIVLYFLKQNENELYSILRSDLMKKVNLNSAFIKSVSKILSLQEFLNAYSTTHLSKYQEDLTKIVLDLIKENKYEARKILDSDLMKKVKINSSFVLSFLKNLPEEIGNPLIREHDAFQAFQQDQKKIVKYIREQDFSVRDIYYFLESLKQIEPVQKIGVDQFILSEIIRKFQISFYETQEEILSHELFKHIHINARVVQAMLSVADGFQEKMSILHHAKKNRIPINSGHLTACFKKEKLEEMMKFIEIDYMQNIKPHPQQLHKLLTKIKKFATKQSRSGYTRRVLNWFGDGDLNPSIQSILEEIATLEQIHRLKQRGQWVTYDQGKEGGINELQQQTLELTQGDEGDGTDAWDQFISEIDRLDLDDENEDD